MVKIRSFISKKSVPRGISIDNKEYWQPFGVTIKSSGSNSGSGGSGGNGGNNGGNGGSDQPTGKCTITIVTTPADVTIRAVDGQGNSYTSKTFQVNKGSQVTVVATPNPSSTGYVDTTKIITSQETNQDSFVCNITLNANTQQEKTTVTVLVNQAGVSVDIYDANNNSLSNGSNIATNVLIGSVISVGATKEGYVLSGSSHGVRTGSGTNIRFSNITVVKDLVINLTLDADSAGEPTITGVETRYDITGIAQTFERNFISKFYKIRAYGDLPISLSTDTQQSSSDSFGGQSIVNNGAFEAQRVKLNIDFQRNDTNQSRNYNFTIVAENVQGQQVSIQFNVVQSLPDAITHKVKIDVYINGTKYNGSDVIRKIEGTFVNADQEIDVVEGSEVDGIVEYLGESWTSTRIIAARTTIRFDIDVAYIHLNSCNVAASNRVLMIDIPSRNINRVWSGEDIPILFNKQFRITGRVNDNTMLPYDSSWLTANSSNVDVNFKRKIDIVFQPVINTEGVIIAPTPSDASVILKIGGATYANGERFNVGTHVGYKVSKEGFITVDVPSTSPDAIIVGTTPMPFMVNLQAEAQKYTVTLQSNPAGARIFLKQDGVDYRNGSSFLPGTWVGYSAVLDGYEIANAEPREDDPNAIYVPEHDYTGTIQLTPSGSDHSISISPETITIGADGGQRTIAVTTDADDFTIQNENTWMTCQKSGNNVIITINPNTGGQRIGNVDFLVQSQTAQLIVTQQAGQVQHTLSLSRNFVQFEANGTVSANPLYNQIEVTTNASDFQVVGPTPSTTDWCTYSREGNVLTFTVTENTGTVRSCKFNVLVDEISEEITINQWGTGGQQEFAATEDGFNYANDGETLTVDFNEDGVTKDIYIHTQENWIVE